jgi:hypothetical protein
MMLLQAFSNKKNATKLASYNFIWGFFYIFTSVLEKGIILIGLGNYYVKLAHTMAKSIKAFNDIDITLITDSEDEAILEPFDNIIVPELKHYLEKGLFNPFKLKTYIYDYSPYEKTIYLDVDGICLKNIDELFNGDFQIQEVKRYNYDNSDDCAMVWTTKAGMTLKDVYNAYNLPKENKYPEYNSSFILFTKNDQTKNYFNRVKHNYLDRKIKFKAIGGKYPDELAFNLSSAQLEFYSDDKSLKPVYFQWENTIQTLTDISGGYYFLGMAGGYHGTRLKSMYEGLAKKHSKHWKWRSREKIFHKN